MAHAETSPVEGLTLPPVSKFISCRADACLATSAEQALAYGAAVEDVLEAAEELQAVSVRAIRLPEGSDRRYAVEEHARELSDRIRARANSGGLDFATLLNLANERIDLDRRHAALGSRRAWK